MPQTYTPEFKKKIVRLHLEEGRTYKSITAEYGVSKASISKWCAEFSEECQTKAILNPEYVYKRQTQNNRICDNPFESFFPHRTSGILLRWTRKG